MPLPPTAIRGGCCPEAERQQIFDPYYRAHDAPSQPASVGLGLYVSRQLARLMGGELDYRCEGGRSIFELRLPAALPAPVAQVG